MNHPEERRRRLKVEEQRRQVALSLAEEKLLGRAIERVQERHRAEEEAEVVRLRAILRARRQAASASDTRIAQVRADIWRIERVLQSAPPSTPDPAEPSWRDWSKAVEKILAEVRAGYERGAAERAAEGPLPAFDHSRPIFDDEAGTPAEVDL
jgi:hypothetical protein